jgi:FMN-dependent NADH-azoreductase
MKNILVIESSSRTNDSFSRKLTHFVLKALKAKAPNALVKTHDLTLSPGPHLDGHIQGGLGQPDDIVLKLREREIAHAAFTFQT